MTIKRELSPRSVKVGDYVKRKYGNKVYVVERAGNYDMTIRDPVTGKRSNFENYCDYTFADDIQEEEGTSMNKTLYEITVNGTVHIAEKLMEKSSTNWLMQVYNTSTVLFVDKADCKEIVPYTVKLRVNAVEFDYRYDEGKLKQGEVYLTSKGDFVFVVAVDTKNKSAKATPPKLVTRLVTEAV